MKRGLVGWTLLDSDRAIPNANTETPPNNNRYTVLRNAERLDSLLSDCLARTSVHVLA